ncbi:MAG: DNA methylase [Bacteroidales bacterium]
MEINKYFKSETKVLFRSEIHPAEYNPRKITENAKKELKKSIKKFGVVGGMVVNSFTNNTLVSGHQKLVILDEMNKYPENDYQLKVEIVDVDEKTEKELNIFFNNSSAQGEWDFDALRELIPDIDYKSAGLTEEDLNIIGVDFLLQTEGEESIASALNEVAAPQRAEKEAKIAHNKEVKEQVRQQAQERAENLDAYVTLSFDTYDVKASFMKRFGYDERDKFLKGEVFENQIERVE